MPRPHDDLTAGEAAAEKRRHALAFLDGLDRLPIDKSQLPAASLEAIQRHAGELAGVPIAADDAATQDAVRATCQALDQLMLAVGTAAGQILKGTGSHRQPGKPPKKPNRRPGPAAGHGKHGGAKGKK